MLAGLTAGTFYPLTLSFILRNLPQSYLHLGIVAYAMDIVVTTHAATSYEAWVIRVLSWPWLFWTISIVTPVMIVLVVYGIPRQPMPQPKPGQSPPSWRGFLYASLGAALLYGALDQGQRLDWWRSGTFVAMFAAGSFLIASALIRHFSMPNPLVNYPFLRQWNVVLLGLTVMLFRFVLLASVVLIPSYLAVIQNYRPDQTGPVLLWLAIPQFLAGALAVYLLGRIDARLILATGFALVAIGCLMDSRISTLWSGNSFDVSQLVLAMGEGLAFNGMVGAIVLDLAELGLDGKGSGRPDLRRLLSDHPPVRGRTRRLLHSVLPPQPAGVSLRPAGGGHTRRIGAGHRANAVADRRDERAWHQGRGRGPVRGDLSGKRPATGIHLIDHGQLHADRLCRDRLAAGSCLSSSSESRLSPDHCGFHYPEISLVERRT